MSDNATAPPSPVLDVIAAHPANHPPSALDEFVRLTRHKKHLERQLADTKRELEPITEQLLDEFQNEGVRRKVTADGVGVGITRKIWARADDGDKDAAADALIAAGLGDYVQRGFNTNSLSAHFREEAKRREDAGDPIALDELLPEPLRGVIALTEDFTLTARLSG